MGTYNGFITHSYIICNSIRISHTDYTYNRINLMCNRAVVSVRQENVVPNKNPHLQA